MKTTRRKKSGKRRTRAYAMQTRLIYGKASSKKWDYNHHVIPPISSSSTYRLDTVKRGAQGFAEFAHHDGTTTIESRAPIYIYDRLGEPNKELLEENLTVAEHGEIAVTFATGMAAISAVLGILTGIGDEIVAHSILYGCTYSLLLNWYPRYAIRTNYIDLTIPSNLEKKITDRTRVIYFESPVNPTLDLIDIKAIAGIVRRVNKHRPPGRQIYVVIDNTFATPFCQRPLEQGADFVVDSLTKGICGFGTDMGGVVVGPRWSLDHLLLYRKDFGGTLSSKSAWPILVYGLPSLTTRVRQQIASTYVVAKFLQNDRRVSSVRYPGLPSFPQYKLARRQMRDYNGKFQPGTLLYFILHGKTPKQRHDNGERFINALAHNAYTITLAVSLGQVRTLIEHPSSMTHSSIPLDEQIRRGLDPGGLRLSIGLEDPHDIKYDLDKALSFLK
jgi:methionine-gamma-lyase